MSSIVTDGGAAANADTSGALIAPWPSPQQRLQSTPIAYTVVFDVSSVI